MGRGQGARLAGPVVRVGSPGPSRQYCAPMLSVEAARPQDDEVDLRGYLLVLARRWKVIAAVVIVVVLAALLFTVQQSPRYQAQSDVLIRQSDSATVIGNQAVNSSDAARQLNNEVKLFESGTIRDAVAKAYHGPLDPTSVHGAASSDSSDLLKAHVTAGDAAEAAKLLNLYVNTFITVRRQQRTDELLAVGQDIQAKISDLDARIAKATPPDAEALRTQRTFYLTQIQNVELSSDISKTGGVQVLTAAKVPTNPVSPKPARDLALALVIGAVLGVGLAFLIDSLDERIRTIADLEAVSGGLPVLGIIPLVGDASTIATRDATDSAQAEAFRSLRTTVKFIGGDREDKVIQVTSPGQGDGKTTVIANLAVAFAAGGDRVAMACCDLRRPTVHERFGVELMPGLTDVIVGDATLEQGLRRIGNSLYLLPAGRPPRNPSELLSSNPAEAIVEALAGNADVVLLDSTPVLPVTDALVVSRIADATIVVIDSRTTTRTTVKRTLQVLAQVDAPVIGLVLNGVSEGSDYGYGYGHNYNERPRAKRGKSR